MSDNEINYKEELFITELKDIVNSTRQLVCSAINYAQVRQNWLIGQKIVVQEQKGKTRAEYGKQIIKVASLALTEEFGRGFSVTNLKNFRQFYLMFRNLSIGQAVSDQSDLSISQTVSDQLPLLSWSHYERLIRVTDPVAREWYMKEASEQMWSYRTLDRNISTMYYRRMLASQNKEIVKQEMQDKTSGYDKNKLEFIKNPSVLEFLDLPANKGYTETVLEQAIIDQMQNFLLELGKGFSFVARQQHVRTETTDFYIDLVFYNYILKCFVIVELKTHSITHQDIGQLDMYVRMYDDLKKGETDNPTIGILLCTETDKTIARYSVLNDNKQLFASKYMDYLPTEKELEEEIERQKALLQIMTNKN